jgi:hypothetical protein
MPSHPAASQTFAPLCIAHVAAVCLRMCGVMCRSIPAAVTAAPKDLRTDATGLPFHSTAACRAKQALPPPQMSEQARRQPHWRLALFRLLRSLPAPVEYAAIDIPSPNCWLEGRRADCGMTGARIETHQNEPGHMPQGMPISRPEILRFTGIVGRMAGASAC